MYFAKGKDRFVLVFPALGIVIKLPIIRIERAFKSILGDVKGRSWGPLKSSCSKWAPEIDYTISGMLFRGIATNRREYFLWKKTRNQFLQPTPFSFLGLLNIQLYGESCGCSHLDMWDQITKITNESAWRNPHQFSEPDNYCKVNGKLRILDYGGHGGTWVVVKYGKRISEEFDFGFRYVE